MIEDTCLVNLAAQAQELIDTILEERRLLALLEEIYQDIARREQTAEEFLDERDTQTCLHTSIGCRPATPRDDSSRQAGEALLQLSALARDALQLPSEYVRPPSAQ